MKGVIFINQSIILYTTGCPQCAVLKKKLDMKGVLYEQNTDTDDMLALGIDEVPVLKVDDKLLSFAEAVKWVSTQ